MINAFDVAIQPNLPSMVSADELKQLQVPLKEKYKANPEKAFITLNASGKIGKNISCKVETGKKIAEVGLHPATGGDGLR